jgi:NAD+ kinase
MGYEKICFLRSESAKSKEAYKHLVDQYGNHDIEEADVVVTLGGDGFLLEVLHNYPDMKKPIYGMNRGTLGFLLNAFESKDLLEKINDSTSIYLCPIRMESTDVDGNTQDFLAYNEVSVIRYSAQSANLKIIVNEVTALEMLACDGVLVSTPAGSTAYNLSAHGPIIPLNSNLLALTPVSPFRPRRWKGALLPNDSVIEIENLDPIKRPIGVAADSREAKNVVHIKVWQDQSDKRHLLFNSAQSLEDRIMREQFNA